MALAVVFGALIGLERSIKRKGFGISSNAILCLASRTISILQIQSVDILVDVVKQNSLGIHYFYGYYTIWRPSD